MMQGVRISCFVLLTWKNFFAESRLPKVAIIGGGIGGASAADFLTQLFYGDIEIDLFEKDKLGGRLANIEIGGDEYEAGGAWMRRTDVYMNYFRKKYGLEEATNYADSLIGFWDGGKFVFQEKKWKWLTNFNKFKQYGIGMKKIGSVAKSIIANFELIYQLQNDGITFDNVTALLSAINPMFPILLKQPFEEHLKDLRISRSIRDEIGKVAIVANYGQGSNVHAFVGYIALASMRPGTYSIHWGNELIPRNIIYWNRNINIIFGRVTKIRLYSISTRIKGYKLSYNIKDTNNEIFEKSKLYDIVIIATPLTADQKHKIKFKGFPDPLIFTFPGQYQTTVASFIKGELNQTYFRNTKIGTIISTKPNETNFNYIRRESPAKPSMNYMNRFRENSEPIWKVLTMKEMQADQLKQLFSRVREGKSRIWKAYPMYDPKEERLDRFKLHEGLYHVNAIEWAASTMEMSAIGGRNAALLAHKYFRAMQGMYLG